MSRVMKTYLCEKCGEQVKQRQPQVRCYGQRWHHACWLSRPGRPENPQAARRTYHAYRLLLPRALFDQVAEAAGKSGEPISEWLRRVISDALGPATL